VFRKYAGVTPSAYAQREEKKEEMILPKEQNRKSKYNPFML